MTTTPRQGPGYRPAHSFPAAGHGPDGCRHPAVAPHGTLEHKARLLTAWCSMLAAAALTTGCASAPARTAAPAASIAQACGALAADIARAETARLAASQKQQDAWKAVIPFAIAARYARAQAEGAEADQALAALTIEFTRQGCDRHDA